MSGPLQNIAVVRAAGGFRALAELTGEPLHESPSAAEAIQRALDALAADGGGAVTLGRGAFPLHEPVRLRSLVWLRGGGRGTRLLVAPGNAAGVALLGEGAHGALVSDMAIAPAEPGGALAGVVLDGCGDAKLRGLLCAGFGGYGAWLRGGSFLCEVSGCSLASNRRANLLLDELRTGPGGSYLPNLVSGCVTYGGGAGVECRRAIAVTISACLVHQPAGPAFHIHSRSNAVSVVGSRSYQGGAEAVLAERSDELSLTGNTFCWHAGSGVVVRDSCWGTIAGNQVVDSGSPAQPGPAPEPRDGVQLIGARGFQVTGNAVFNWPAAPPLRRGVWEDERSAANSVVGNGVSSFAEAAVRCEGRGTAARDNIAAERPHNLAPGAEPPELQRFRSELADLFAATQVEGEMP